MGVLISTAIVITASAPLVPAAGLDVSPATTATETSEGSTDGAKSRPYVIVSIPVFNRERLQLTSIVRPSDDFDLEHTPSSRHPTRRLLNATSIVGPADVAYGSSATLKDAVVAAHDERILLIRKRIDQVRSEATTSNRMLAGLSVRLERAEAARRIAANRASCCQDEALARPQQSHTSEVFEQTQLDRGTGSAVTLRGQSPSSPLLRGRVKPTTEPSVLPPSPSPRTINIPPSFAPKPTGASLQVTTEDHHPTGAGISEALRSSRAKLGEARRILEGGQPATEVETVHFDQMWSSPAQQLALALTLLIGSCGLAQTRRISLPAISA